jgi:hypothetical protein
MNCYNCNIINNCDNKIHSNCLYKFDINKLGAIFLMFMKNHNYIWNNSYSYHLQLKTEFKHWLEIKNRDIQKFKEDYNNYINKII